MGVCVSKICYRFECKRIVNVPVLNFFGFVVCVCVHLYVCSDY